MSYESTLQYIHSVKWQGAKPGLDRTKELLAKLGNPEKNLKFVHIAGTNGKGSTAACISSVLRMAGYKTGLYTSPYILRFNERMQINGEHISDEELESLTDEIRPFADDMSDAPTEFELITALAMQFFAQNGCDIVVLEVGMGGELDSTNVIELPEVAVITAIGLDHTKELGGTITEIAKAKAGIIKAGCDVVSYGGDEAVTSVLREVCSEKNANLFTADFLRLNIKNYGLDCIELDFAPYAGIKLPLVSSYQPKNMAVAVTALERLRALGYNITDENIVTGLTNVYWPGRFEILGRNPVIVLDGAHNPHGMDATAKSLRLHFGDKKIVFLLGVMADKNVEEMAGVLSPMAAAFVAVEPPNPRAMKAGVLAGILAGLGFPAYPCDTIAEGVKKAVSLAGGDGIVCALGSLYFSGDVRDAVFALN